MSSTWPFHRGVFPGDGRTVLHIISKSKPIVIASYCLLHNLGHSPTTSLHHNVQRCRIFHPLPLLPLSPLFLAHQNRPLPIRRLPPSCPPCSLPHKPSSLLLHCPSPTRSGSSSRTESTLHRPSSPLKPTVPPTASNTTGLILNAYARSRTSTSPSSATRSSRCTGSGSPSRGTHHQ